MRACEGITGVIVENNMNTKFNTGKWKLQTDLIYKGALKRWNAGGIVDVVQYGPSRFTVHHIGWNETFSTLESAINYANY